MKANRWHRRIAVVSVFFLVVTALTGILWAYAPHLYFKAGYLQKKDGIEPRSLKGAKISALEAIENAGKNFQEGLQSVTLRSDAGMLVYEIKKKAGKVFEFSLVDAVSGARVSPLRESLATSFAAQYVAGNPPVKSVVALNDYTHRNGKKFKAAYKIAFSAPGDPEIYIDRNSGQVFEDSDNIRAFHFWVQRLHQMQFFGTKKELTIIPGVALLLLVATGSVIWLRRWRTLQ